MKHTLVHRSTSIRATVAAATACMLFAGIAVCAGKHKNAPPAETGSISRVTDTLANESYPAYIIRGNNVYDYSPGGGGQLAFVIQDDHHYVSYLYTEGVTTSSRFYYDDDVLCELCPYSRDTIAVFHNDSFTNHTNTGDIYDYSYSGNTITVVHRMKPKNYIRYYRVNGIAPSLAIMFLLGGHCYNEVP